MALIAHGVRRFAAGMLLLGACAMPAAAVTPEDGRSAAGHPAEIGGTIAAVTPEDGRRAYDAGHFTDAMGIWAGLSRQGNAEAAFGLGLLYDLGNGTPENPDAAFFWYKLAADAGVVQAEFNVAAMYDSGRGVARNDEAAAQWYAKAAANGYQRAQFDLGLLYESGEGVPRNPAAAAAWFKAAADSGLPAAKTRLKVLQGTSPGHDGPLARVALSSPGKNANLTITTESTAVPLVWVAPREPEPVHYEVQVVEVGSHSSSPVYAASVDVTASVAHLPPKADTYVWRVDTVGQDRSRVSTASGSFSVNLDGDLRQSQASAPEASHASR